MNRDDIVRDLTPFCDIGEKGPSASEKDGKINAKLTRDGKAIKVVVDLESGKAHATVGSGQTKYYGSFRQLLASDAFANLRRWADSQRDYLKREAVSSKDLIPVRGRQHGGVEIGSIEEIDDLLGRQRPSLDSAEVLLLDGPGGIGKTTVIEQLAMLRAEGYRISNKPLLLHVKSRGRVLSNLQDLMAFSLQTLRLSITYDQVPVLVKHGLVLLAIDGFDELGDPNGYELAWAQINDLVTSVRGQGAIILSGRDTFIGRDRLFRDVKALRLEQDVVSEVVLEVPSPEQAKEWLKRSGQWTEASFNLPAVSVLLEPNSYALRPVFLRMLREEIKPKEIKEKSENDLAALLVNHMIDRESRKFGDAVESTMTLPRVRAFVETFLKEVARDMADSQSESLDANAVIWIAEAALGDEWSAEVGSLVKNRAGVIAFLADDERSGHRRFSHAQIMNYFLAHVTLDAVSGGDFPKYIRRNLLGKDFLSTFSDVMLERSSVGDLRVNDFLSESRRFINNYSQSDRGARNIGALLISSLPSFDSSGLISIGGFQADDVLIKRTVPPSRIENSIINQLDARGADLSAIEFSSVSILRLIADDASRFSATFPNVTVLIDGSGQQITEDLAISLWLDAQGRVPASEESGDTAVPVRLRGHSAFKLLGRACRLRQYWLRSEGDQHAARVINDKWWGTVAGVLAKHGFLREEVDKQASGKSSIFYHVRQADRLLGASKDDPDLVLFYKELLNAIEAAE
ncbi:hypothetical protein [Lysobacter sp. Root559]|uniref:hypothetical protein n=1 Tax=Lysobacter sp. Root559 TaxID=1736559 RepID=UPI000A660858|nr:hypothetical protein [Lysobacter sp. Root559]